MDFLVNAYRVSVLQNEKVVEINICRYNEKMTAQNITCILLGLGT